MRCFLVALLDQCSHQNFEVGGCRGVESQFFIRLMTHSLIIKLYSTIPTIVLHPIAVYLHLYNCLVMITINTDWLCMHAIILMGGAAASETLIRGYICAIGGQHPPKTA